MRQPSGAASPSVHRACAAPSRVSVPPWHLRHAPARTPNVCERALFWHCHAPVRAQCGVPTYVTVLCQCGLRCTMLGEPIVIM
eukprot:254527-Prymnesium_polylepis.1